MTGALGPDTPVSHLTDDEIREEIVQWLHDRWDGAAQVTYNRHLDGLRSAIGYWANQAWLSADPTRPIRRRPLPPDRTRALSHAQVDRLLSREDIGLRERVLWRLLYESAAQASAVLALDVCDLDLPNRGPHISPKPLHVRTSFRRGRCSSLPTARP